MAGDWIKCRVDLPTDPAVIAMAAALDCDEFDVVGRLMAFWAWADRHVSENGHAPSVTGKWIDRAFRCDGFAQAMASVGWLVIDATGVTIPRWSRHNGTSAKDRALAADRKRKERNADKDLRASSAGLADADAHQDSPVRVGFSHADGATGVNETSRCERDTSVTREEKSINTPLPPAADAAGGVQAPVGPLQSPAASACSDAEVQAGSANGVDDEQVSGGAVASAAPAGQNAALVEQPGRTGAISLATYLAQCAEQGKQAIPPGCGALRYAADIGLPDELVALHWAEFRERHHEPAAKRYRDWPKAFGHSIRDNWYKFWRVEAGGSVVMAPQAMQARKRHEQRSAQQSGVPA